MKFSKERSALKADLDRYSQAIQETKHRLNALTLIGQLPSELLSDIFLLRTTNEVRVWKMQQASILCYNLFSLGGMLWSWKQQGRWSLEVLEGGDLVHFGAVLGLAAVRAGFCVGVGLVGDDGDEKM